MRIDFWARWENQDYTVSGFGVVAHGWGRCASMKAKRVISTASADIAASSRTFFRLIGSGVAKHPQLMSMCKRYARRTITKNPSMITVRNEAQMRRRQPISTRSPRTISANGKVCATNWTPQAGSNLKASTWRAKLARFVEMENFRKKRCHRVWLGRKALE